MHQIHFGKWLVREYIPLILPIVSASCHKLQEPSKESVIFQSLGTTNFVLFIMKILKICCRLLARYRVYAASAANTASAGVCCECC